MKHPPDKLTALYIFAFVKSALSITNLFAILVVTKLVVTNSVKQPVATIAIMWALIIGLVPFGIILYFYFFKHERLEKLSAQMDNLLNRNLNAAITLGLTIVGVFFALSGLFDALRR